MIEKRSSPRYKADVVVDFSLPDSRATGVTYDLSREGMFVRTRRLPEEGAVLFVTLHLPGGSKMLLHGKVVRAFRAPGLLRTVMPTGFGYRVSKTPVYERFVDSLHS